MEHCLCGRPTDTHLSPFCQDCRLDPARLNEVIALRAEIEKLQQERNVAVGRAERAERTASFWETRWHGAHAPETYYIGRA